MAKFEPIFEKVIRIEGGFTLHEIEGDLGGMTYAGISRVAWPDWEGWDKIDNKEFDAELTGMVRQFYLENYWQTMKGDQIKSQDAAYHVFAFSVNTGRTVARKLAQQVIGATPDGVFGPKTIATLNDCLEDEKDDEIFILRYSLLKVFRYKNICMADKRRKKDIVKSNLQFLNGWINRVELGLAA